MRPINFKHRRIKTERPPPLRTNSGRKQGGVVQMREVAILDLASENPIWSPLLRHMRSCRPPASFLPPISDIPKFGLRKQGGGRSDAGGPHLDSYDRKTQTKLLSTPNRSFPPTTKLSAANLRYPKIRAPKPRGDAVHSDGST